MYETVSAPIQLPRGRHNLSRGTVAADQRRRMLTAVAEVFAEQGYAYTTVSRILLRARVSRRTFYEQFDGKDACLLAAYDDAEQRAWELGAAAASHGDWPQRVGAALAAALDFVVAEPAAGHLFTLEARASCAAIGVRHQIALDSLALALRAGNRPPSDLPQLPKRTERALVEQVAALAGSYLLSGAVELLPSLAPQLLEHLLVPYREGGSVASLCISPAARRGPR
jgi:AcrR family transcriptional regulator